MSDKTVNIYQAYLAVTQAKKRLAALGLRVGSVLISSDKYGGSSESSDGIPYKMLLAEVYANVEGFQQAYTIQRNTPDMTIEEARREEQRQREDALLKLQQTYNDVSVFRQQGNAYAYFESSAQLGVRLSFGQALCERVVVDTKKVRKPVDPEALERAIESVEHVEVEEPVYGWKCNDAEIKAL